MARFVWKNLVGQKHIKDVLGTAFERNVLGHAYLFCGQEGTGAFAAALELAFGLLCDDGGEVPCYRCDACRQIMAANHPDLHCLFPVSLAREHKSSSDQLNEAGWRAIADACRARIAQPYKVVEASGAPQIPVEWIRELNHAIQRGAVRGSRNVVILDGVDQLGSSSANAMLKTLEEPPANTFILLVTDRLHAVLPTIVSRCQIMRLGQLTGSVVLEALSRLCNRPESDPDLMTASQMSLGSLSRALQFVEQPENQFRSAACKLLELLAGNDWLAIAAYTETMVDELCGRGRDYLAGERVVVALLEQVRSGFLATATGAENYFSASSENLPGFTASLEAPQVEQLVGACQRAITSLRGYGNLHLVLVNLFFSIMEIVHEQEQQPG